MQLGYDSSHNTMAIIFFISFFEPPPHSHLFQRSIIDEINRESETDVITIIISYLLMFVYITIFLGHVRSIKTICVSFESRHCVTSLLCVSFVKLKVSMCTLLYPLCSFEIFPQFSLL